MACRIDKNTNITWITVSAILGFIFGGILLAFAGLLLFFLACVYTDNRKTKLENPNVEWAQDSLCVSRFYTKQFFMSVWLFIIALVSTYTIMECNSSNGSRSGINFVCAARPLDGVLSIFDTVRRDVFAFPGINKAQRDPLETNAVSLVFTMQAVSIFVYSIAIRFAFSTESTLSGKFIITLKMAQVAKCQPGDFYAETLKAISDRSHEYCAEKNKVIASFFFNFVWCLAVAITEYMMHAHGTRLSSGRLPFSGFLETWPTAIILMVFSLLASSASISIALDCVRAGRRR